MSDDEGTRDDDGAHAESDPVDAASVAADASESDDEELGLVEDAAGTDDDMDDIENGGNGRAHPEKPGVDPIQHQSNKPRMVIVVPNDERTTDNRIHRAEASAIIATRARQIAKFATAFVEIGPLHDPVAIAHKEFFSRRCPLILRRVVGAGPDGEVIVEDWTVRTMTLPAIEPPALLGSGAR